MLHAEAIPNKIDIFHKQIYFPYKRNLDFNSTARSEVFNIYTVSVVAGK